MAEAAHEPKLKEAFEKHLEQTRHQVERLQRAFALFGEKAQPKPCKAMMGLIDEMLQQAGLEDMHGKVNLEKTQPGQETKRRKTAR